MAGYLLIESRDPLESRDVASHFYDLAAGLARRGEPVTLFLVQNGVFPARRRAQAAALDAVARAGVEVLADDFSLRERAIDATSLKNGVSSSAIDQVVDLLASGAKALFY